MLDDVLVEGVAAGDFITDPFGIRSVRRQPSVPVRIDALRWIAVKHEKLAKVSALLLALGVATFGLLMVITICKRQKLAAAPFAVASFINTIRRLG